MRGAKGLDDLYQMGLSPRVRRFRAVPSELGLRRDPHVTGVRGHVERGLTLERARDTTTITIRRFIRDRRANRGKALLVRSGAGVGKTTATAAALARYGGNARILVGTLKLAREAAEAHRYHLIEGRNRRNCERFEVVQALALHGHPVGRLACGTPVEPRCPLRNSCPYFLQFDAPGHHIGTTEQLFNPNFLRGGDLLVLDDAELLRSLMERQRIDAATLERSVEQLSGRHRRRALEAVQLLRHAVVDAPGRPLLGGEAWDHLAATAWRTGTDLTAVIEALPKEPTLPVPGEGRAGPLTAEDVEAVPPAAITRLLTALQEELAQFRTGEDFNSSIGISSHGIDLGRLRRHVVDDHGKLIVARLPMLILDATPVPTAVDHLTALHERLPDLEASIALPSNVSVVQYATRANGHTALSDPAAVDRVLELIAADRRQHPVERPEDEAVIAYRSLRSQLLDAGFDPARVLSFGSVRGTNALANVRQLYVIGRPFPPGSDLVYQAHVLHHGGPPISDQLCLKEAAYGGQDVAIRVADYEDARVAELLHAQREDELTQVVHRARLFALSPQGSFEADGRQQVRLVLVTSHPVPGLRVDELVLDGGQPSGNDLKRQEAEARVSRVIDELVASGRQVKTKELTALARSDGRTVARVLKQRGSALGTGLDTHIDALPVEPTAVGAIGASSQALGNALDTHIKDLFKGIQPVPQTNRPPLPLRQEQTIAAADDGLPCGCSGCASCGNGFVLHERARLRGRWVGIGVCSWCQRVGGRAA